MPPDYLRPWVVHCDSPDSALANKEFMFPFVSVVKCPQDEMLGKIGGTLVGSAITEDAAWRRQLVDAPNIDRLNLGPIPTINSSFAISASSAVDLFSLRSTSRIFFWTR